MKSLRVLGWWFVALLALWSVNVKAQESLCAVVKIEISQELTMERQAFEATMRITNSLDTLALENVKINILFRDADDNPVLASSDPNSKTARFFIDLDQYQKINSVTKGANGALTDGKIDPAQAAELRWLIVPTVGAGGNDGQGRLYFVGATLSFTYGGESQTIEVAPDTIVVKPQPNLVLDYFLPSEVNGDNPFTPEIEPVEPYHLGVRLANTGSGPAHAVKIQSAQPKIVENKLNLLVDFKITGSFVNDKPAAKTLLLDFGNIPAASNTTGRWIMETTLTGRFTEFDATFTHADEYGGKLTSLIEAVNTHFLVRDVIVDLPGRDSVRDFLAKDGDALVVYESERTGNNLLNCTDCLKVNSLGGSLGAGNNAADGTRHLLTVAVKEGLGHIKISDPYQGAQALSNVIRADGKVLNPANYWLSKTIKEDKINYDYFLNVFDTTPAASYILVFGGQPQVNEPPVIQYIANYTTYETGQVGFLVQASDSDKTVPVLKATNLPAGATFTDKGNGQGVFNWFPQIGQAGSYHPSFEASDGQLTATRSTQVVVFPVDDRDGDGLPDAWELEHFGDLSRDGTGDFDGDGILDKDEFERGSDPTASERAPAAPQLDTPADAAEVTSLTPTLRVKNGDNGELSSVTYTFEIYENESMTQLLARVDEVPEGTTTTEIALDSATLAGNTLKDNRHYFWRVNARTQSGASEWVNGRFFVNTQNDPPAAFTLSKPTDQTLVDTLTPTLIVNNSADIDGDALTYSFKVFEETDINFSNPVAQVSGLAEGVQGQTSWTVSTPLLNGQLYFWVAVVTDEHGASTVGEAASFIVSMANTAPSEPVILSPTIGEVITTTHVVLVTNNAFDSERQELSYFFELDTVNTFDSANKRVSGAVAEGNSQTQWAVSGLVEGQTYYWRVKAFDGSAESGWATASFQVASPNQAPETPNINNPADNAWVEVLKPTLSVHPVVDPNGDVVSYQFELYSDEAMTTRVAAITSATPDWVMTAELTNHRHYYWRARAVDPAGLASAWTELHHFFINQDGINDPPSFSFVLPDRDLEVYGGEVVIQWVDQDPDSNALISLYYNDTQLIVSNLPEDADGEGDRFVWNIDHLPVGTYTLSAVIDDGEHRVRVEACCTIQKLQRSAAVKVTPVSSLVTDEFGLQIAEVDIALESAPNAGTTVLINLSVSDPNEAEILGGKTYLEFTPDNWATAQRIRIKGRDDCVIDGDKDYYLQFSPAVSADSLFNGMMTPDLRLTNADNEHPGQTYFVCDYQLVGQQVLPSGESHYEYKARLRNGGLGINSASAQVRVEGAGNSSSTSIVSGNPVAFPATAGGESVWSVGTFTLSVPANESVNTQALSWNVTGYAPRIDSEAPASAVEGQAYSYQIRVSGREGDSFTYSLIAAPEGMTIDPMTGLVQWQPEVGQQGSHRILVEVRDQAGGVSRQEFVVSVSPAGQSGARVVIVDTNPVANVDYHSLADAVAAQAGTLTEPVIIRARASSGRPDFKSVVIGNDIVTSATNRLTLILEQGYTLDVTADQKYIRAIQIRAQHVTLKGEGGKIIIRNNGFSYVKGVLAELQEAGAEQIYDSLIVEGVETGDVDSFVGIDTGDPDATYVLRNNVAYGFTGSYQNYGLFVKGTAYVYNNTAVGNRGGIRIATDKAVVFNNLSVSNTREDYTAWGGSWTVTGHNISSDQTSPNADFRGRQVDFVDPEAGNFTLAPWDQGALGQGMNLSAVEHYAFSIDALGQARSEPWDVGAHTVGPVTNWPPFIETQAITRAEEQQPYLYQVLARDQDGDSLTYSLTTAPTGMTIDPETGAIEWVPQSDQVGDYTVVVEVGDGRGGLAQQTFTLVVSPAGSGGARLVVVDTNPEANVSYRSLADAIAGEAGTLSQPLLIRVRATSGVADTQRVNITDIGTSAESPLTIVLEKGYKLEVSATQNYLAGISIQIPHVRIKGEGGEIVVRNEGYNYSSGISVGPQPVGSVIVLENLRIRGIMTGLPSSGSGISASDANATYVLRNNVITGFTGIYTNHGMYVVGTAFIYNNTLVGNRYGLRVETDKATVYNNLSVANLAEDYTSWQKKWTNTSHNLSSDLSSPDWNYRLRWVLFANILKDDYRLSKLDIVAKGRGMDLSDIEHYPFNYDATGATRSAPWHIGAMPVAF